MSTRIKRRWILLTGCLVLGACSKETIIREIPASTSPDAGSTQNENPGEVDPESGSSNANSGAGESDMVDGETPTTSDSDTVAVESNMVPGEGDTGNGMDPDTGMEPGTDAVIDTDADTSIDAVADGDLLEDPLETGQSAGDSDADSNADEASPGSELVDREPGSAVDCEDTLPCHWTSDDLQFTVTVTNADNIGALDRLLLNYTIEALHDTQVVVNGGGRAVDTDGVEYLPGEQLLGSGMSGNAQSLMAGRTLEGSIEFNRSSDADSLAAWSLTIVDGGIARLPVFGNIPIGPITTGYADCQGELPCVWMTPDGGVRITLTTAGGFATSGRLSTTFTVTPGDTIDVALEAGALAFSADGARFEGRTHSLGAYSGFGKLTAGAYGGYPLSGSVDFYRNAASPTMLKELFLVLYQDNPVPRWNPRFVNVPLLP